MKEVPSVDDYIWSLLDNLLDTLPKASVAIPHPFVQTGLRVGTAPCGIAEVGVRQEGNSE